MTDHSISFNIYRNPKQPKLHRSMTGYDSHRPERRRQRRIFRQRMCDALLGAVFAALPLLILMAL